jgi:predicted small secreted protein
MKHALLIILALTMATVVVSACNTVHGTGEDLEKASGR